MGRFVTWCGRRAPIAVLLLLPFLSAVAGLTSRPAEARPALPRPAGAGQAQEPRIIEVVARRYAFEPAEIEVAEGERVRLLVKSGDGLHGLEIKRFRVSEEVPRGGKPVEIDFTASEPGRFPILCSVYCGDGHNDMKGTLVVTARGAVQP